MSLLRRSMARIASIFRRDQDDADLNEELNSHLEFAIDENLASGMTPAEARRTAMLRFGNLQRAREEQRASRGFPWLDILMQDLRFTFRTLRRDRTFAAIAIFILALGIGANVIVFSLVNTILLRPLPFPHAEELVRIVPKASKCGASCATYSTDAVQVFQRRNRSFADVTGYDAFTSPGNWKLTTGQIPVPVTEIDVMDNFFHTLGVQPLVGRIVFTENESRPNAPPVAIVSYGFWKRQLNADKNIIGKPLSLNNNPYTVIGVLPAAFDFGSIYSPGATFDVFTPYIYDSVREYGNMLSLTGRLKPGVTLAQAQAEANDLFPDLPFSIKQVVLKNDYTGQIWDLKSFIAGSLRHSLVVLWAAVGLILLIVCVNLSNLLLARVAARTREFALRGALGASRSRIVRQLLTEALVLSTAGAVLGLGLAFAGVFWLSHQASLALPLLSTLHLDRMALIWTFLIAVLAAALFGVAPGLRVSGDKNLQDALKSSTANTSGSGTARLRSILVISEIALACVLLVGAGLLLRSFLRVLDIDLGFQPAQSASIALDYDDGNDRATRPAKRNAIFQEVLHRVQVIPGIEVAGISDSLPMSRNRSWGISAKGKQYRPGELPGTFVYVVSPGYLQTIGIPLLRGRDFAWDDNSPTAAVVIINKTVADCLWPGEDAVGRMASAGGTDVRVIGVVADVRETSAESSPGWQMYVSALAPQFGPEDSKLVIRSRLPAKTLQTSVLAALRGLNPGQPAADLVPIQQIVDHAGSPRRFFVYLVGGFAGLGLLLASLGTYGVISYSVTQRTQEIGIRIAIGATRATVQLDILRRTAKLAATGIAVGTVVSIAITHLIASLLFGTSPSDPLTFLTIVVLLATVALLAGYLPARRASRIDPMSALRES